MKTATQTHISLVLVVVGSGWRTSTCITKSRWFTGLSRILMCAKQGGGLWLGITEVEEAPHKNNIHTSSSQASGHNNMQWWCSQPHHPRRKYVKSFSKISLASLAPRLVCCLFVLEDSSVRNSDRIPLSVISQNNARVRTLEARLLGHWDGRIESEELVDFRRLWTRAEMAEISAGLCGSWNTVLIWSEEVNVQNRSVDQRHLETRFGGSATGAIEFCLWGQEPKRILMPSQIKHACNKKSSIWNVWIL